MSARATGLALLLVAACGGSAASTGGGDDAVVGAWKAAKLDVSALTTVEPKPYAATACRGGTVGGVDVVLCRYASGEDAHAAEELGLAAIGNATGAALAHGTQLLVIADRRKVDPSGRTVQAIARAFKK